jgi:hypothetical protein
VLLNFNNHFLHAQVAANPNTMSDLTGGSLQSDGAEAQETNLQCLSLM